MRVAPRVRVVADIAFAITVAGVAIEIALMTVGSRVAFVGAVDEGAAVLAAGIVGLGQAGTGVPVAMGVSGILLSIAMLRTKLVSAWISVVGLVGGVAFLALIAAPLPIPGVAALATPVALLALVLVVVWMLATSIAFSAARGPDRPNRRPSSPPRGRRPSSRQRPELRRTSSARCSAVCVSPSSRSTPSSSSMSAMRW